MGALSQKVSKEESREYDEHVVKTTQLAKQSLGFGGITSEVWADELKVTTRTIQRWRNGEVEIPQDKRAEIIWKGKELITRQREAIEREIDFWITQTYGPSGKR